MISNFIKVRIDQFLFAFKPYPSFLFTKLFYNLFYLPDFFEKEFDEVCKNPEKEYE